VIITMRIELNLSPISRYWASLGVWLHDEEYANDGGDEDIYIEGGSAETPDEALEHLLHDVRILLSDRLCERARDVIQRLNREPFSHTVTRIDVPLYLDR